MPASEKSLPTGKPGIETLEMFALPLAPRGPGLEKNGLLPALPSDWLRLRDIYRNGWYGLGSQGCNDAPTTS